MKHLATAALMVNLGAAGIYAQQQPVKMAFSGSKVATAINLAPNSRTDELHLDGIGALGAFTFHLLRADEYTPQSFGKCGDGSGPHLRVVDGGGVFRFLDGSLLTVKLKEGALCVDLDHVMGHITDTYDITGGT